MHELLGIGNSWNLAQTPSPLPVYITSCNNQGKENRFLEIACLCVCLDICV